MTFPQLYDIYHRHPVVTTDTRNCPDGVFFSRCAVKSSTATPLHSMRWPKVVPMPWWTIPKWRRKTSVAFSSTTCSPRCKSWLPTIVACSIPPYCKSPVPTARRRPKNLWPLCSARNQRPLHRRQPQQSHPASPSPCSVCVRNMILPSSKPVPITPAKLHS